MYVDVELFSSRVQVERLLFLLPSPTLVKSLFFKVGMALVQSSLVCVTSDVSFVRIGTYPRRKMDGNSMEKKLLTSC